MNKTFMAGGALAGLVVAGGLAGMVSAQSVAETTGLTEEEVVAIAQTEFAGEVQDVDLERQRGMQVYEIVILGEDGTEMEVEVAAETGEVLRVRAEGEGCDHDGGRERDRDRDRDGEDEDDVEDEA